jgi:hypothetical protein
VGNYNYGIGDLVLCRYDFEYLYYPTYLSDSQDMFFLGIIVDQKENQIVYFDRDIVYEVLCMDGHRRFFAKWEMVSIRKA